MANPLGTCRACSGDLCLRGKVVACQKCGLSVPDHPLTRDQPAPAKASDVVIPPQDYVASVPDRVNTLERIVADQAARLARLEDRLASRIEAVPALGVASVTTPAPAPLPVRRK